MSTDNHGFWTNGQIVNVETIPAKFAPQKKVSHSYVADDYVKSIKLVLNKTAITQRPNKQVN